MHDPAEVVPARSATPQRLVLSAELRAMTLDDLLRKAEDGPLEIRDRHGALAVDIPAGTITMGSKEGPRPILPDEEPVTYEDFFKRIRALEAWKLAAAAGAAAAERPAA